MPLRAAVGDGPDAARLHKVKRRGNLPFAEAVSTLPAMRRLTEKPIALLMVIACAQLA